MDLRNMSFTLRPALMATVIIILISSAVLWLMTNQMPASFLPGYPGDAFFPRLALCVVILFAVFVLIATLRRPKGPAADADTRKTAADAVMAGTVADADTRETVQIDVIETTTITLIGLAFMVLLEPAGLEIATFLMMFALLLPRLIMPLPRAIAIAAIGALATMLVIYAAFVLGLKVSLPVRFFPAFL